jgi:ketosteroid isomerase-like protein
LDKVAAMTPRTALASSLALAALACGPHRIPGTEVRDTKENRAVYDVVQGYRQAMERKDAAAVLALVAPTYHDTAGTLDPSDDLDRARLEQTLPADLARADAVKLDFTVRRIDVKGDEAQVEVFYDQYYRVKTATGEVPRRDSDIHRIRLVRMDGAWKIASGL